MSKKSHHILIPLNEERTRKLNDIIGDDDGVTIGGYVQGFVFDWIDIEHMIRQRDTDKDNHDIERLVKDEMRPFAPKEPGNGPGVMSRKEFDYWRGISRRLRNEREGGKDNG